MTTSAACASMAPVTMSRVMMPRAFPSITMRSSISWRGYIVRPPFEISFSIAW
jgi:hypothetical protein